MSERYDEKGCFVLYRNRPSTPDPSAPIVTLRAELDRVREIYGSNSTEGWEANARLVAAYARDGRRIDELRRYSKEEHERFFSYTVPGPDGHIYWTGGQLFYTNSGSSRRPGRWYWEHEHGPIASNTLWVRPTCGDEACINPQHSECGLPDRTIYRETTILGGLQVFAMQLGRTPSGEEWEKAGMRPTRTQIGNRFGTWNNAIRAAGLVERDPIHTDARTPTDCLKALRAVKKYLGHWPSLDEFRSSRINQFLAEHGLPRSSHTINKHLGSWPEALRKAGRR